MSINLFVIDDSEIARNMLIRLLKQDPEVNIVGEAGTGLAGLMFMDEKRPDAIMLETDVTGGMKLLDIIAEIKKLDAGIKIVLCADPKTMDSIIPAMEGGADHFITKPYVGRKVAAVIGELKREISAERE